MPRCARPVDVTAPALGVGDSRSEPLPRLAAAAATRSEVLVRDFLARAEVVVALDVELNPALPFPGRTSNEVAHLQLRVGGQAHVAEAVVAADHTVLSVRQVEILDLPRRVIAPH